MRKLVTTRLAAAARAPAVVDEQRQYSLRAATLRTTFDMNGRYSGTPDDEGDLGFTCRARKSGDVEILHHGRLATILRHADAAAFLAELVRCSSAQVQQRMARLTGNYRRGNERLARWHPRNPG